MNPTSMFTTLKENYTIKDFVAPKFHLSYECLHVRVGTTTWWVMGSLKYINEALWKVCALLKVTNLQTEKLPSSTPDHPELYLSPLLGEEQHCIHQNLVGMGEWMVQIGIFNISDTVTSLNRLSATTWEGHLKMLVNIIGC